MKEGYIMTYGFKNGYHKNDITYDLMINKETLISDLQRAGYDSEHVSTIIECISKCCDYTHKGGI